MTDILKPSTDADILEIVKWAVAEKIPLETVGHGSKQRLGRPTQTAHTLDLSGLSGVTLFEPEELILSAKAGTPLSDIQSLLNEHDQEFQFEPVDLASVYGNEPGAGTLGGLVSTNICGPRRLKSGSVRDHILGINAVSGRGEVFKSGGRVVKNVTGYDLSKGVTGAYGTLAVLTDITMKVLPKAETEQTLILTGLSDAEATGAMAEAMGSSTEVSGAAHLPAGNQEEKSRTVFRLEGFNPSVAYRIEKLAKLFGKHSKQTMLSKVDSKSLWSRIRDCQVFEQDLDKSLWRLSCVPSEGHKIVDELSKHAELDAYYDWQGGLIWLQLPIEEATVELVRRTLAKFGGGHATLIRAKPDVRLKFSVFQPQPAPLAALSERYRDNFDPYGILNPGRMTAPLAQGR